MKNKYMIFPMVMSFVAFTCFAFLASLFLSVVHPMWAETLVLLIPALVLGIFAILSAKGWLGEAASITLTCVFSFLFVAVGFYYTCFLFFTSYDANCTTDPNDYTAALRQIDSNDCVREYFPRNIPETASDVTLHYHPALFQGGEEFECSYRTTGQDIAAWTERLQGTAQWMNEGGEIYYKFYWNDSNHGEKCYVIIDPSINRITFCYADW